MSSIFNQKLPFIALCFLLVAAAIFDLRSQRIPNRLTYPAAIAALLYYYFMNGVDGFVFSAAGLAAGICTLIAPYLMGGMGAGDAKLMGAVGAVVGAKGAFIAFLFTAIMGGFYAVFILVARRKQFEGFFKDILCSLQLLILTRTFFPDAAPEGNRRPRLCYGLPIALGSITYIALDLSGYSFPI